jgi:hypothetical protein
MKVSERFAKVFRRKPSDPLDLDEYWGIPSCEGWQNKPQRYLYDALREIYHLRLEIEELKKRLGE